MVGECTQVHSHGSRNLRSLDAFRRTCIYIYMVTVQNPPGHVPPGHLPQGHIPQGHIPPGHLPPGHLPPGHIPPRTYTPQDIYPPDFRMPYLVHASCVDYILHFKSIYFAEITFICDGGAKQLTDICSVRKG